jgi:hypothetical protein
MAQLTTYPTGQVIQGTNTSSGNIPYFNIDTSAYQNPNGNQAGNWAQGMNNFIPTTTGNATLVGQSPQYGGAQLGQTATFNGAQLNGQQYNQVFGQQQQLANQLLAQSQGQGPSAALTAAQQQGQANLSNQIAAQAAARGTNPALAAYNAAQAGQVAAGQTAQNSVTGQTQEILGVQANAGNQLSSMNTAAQNYASTNAGYTQQAQLANQNAINQMATNQAGLYQQSGLNNANLQQQGMLANQSAQQAQQALNAQQYDSYMNILNGQQQQQWGANQQQQATELQQQLGLGNINAGISATNTAANMQTTGSVMDGVGAAAGLAAAAMSDERFKFRIRPGHRAIDRLLGSIGGSH